MSKVNLTLTCVSCGNTFNHVHFCRNTTEAETYKVWAAKNVTICPECYKKAIAAEKAEKCAEALAKCAFTLPELNGVSDKQIAYARKVREAYIYDNLGLLNKYAKVLQTLKDPEQRARFAKQCKDYGLTFDEGLKKSLKNMGLTKLHIMLTSKDAHEILET